MSQMSVYNTLEQVTTATDNKRDEASLQAKSCLGCKLGVKFSLRGFCQLLRDHLPLIIKLLVKCSLDLDVAIVSYVRDTSCDIDTVFWVLNTANIFHKSSE